MFGSFQIFVGRYVGKNMANSSGFRTWFFIDGPLDVLVTASCSRLEDAAVQNFQSPLIDLLRPGAGKGTNPESRPEDVGNQREIRTCVKAWFLFNL